MTPAAIYKAVRDFLVLAAIAFIAWRIFTDGKNAVHADQFNELKATVQQQAAIQAAWHKESTDANTQLAASLGRINSAPVIVHDWMRPSESCAGNQVLPATAGATSSGAAPGGRVQPVARAAPDQPEVRDTVVADFKRFWEGRLAGWRLEHDEWPKP